MPGSTDLLGICEQPSVSRIEEPEAHSSLVDAVLGLQTQMTCIMDILSEVQTTVNEI